jgi:hypothetical protein
MTDDLFYSSKLMLKRANHHIADLETQINAFTADKPWTFVVEKDAQGTTDHHKVKFTSRLAEDIPSILADAANNLRSVLDPMAFAIAVKHTGLPKPKSAKFPFGPTESDMLNNAKGGCKDLPPEIVAHFKSFKPYKGGNNLLWAVNELANAPKHQTIVPVGLNGGAVNYNINIIKVGRVFATPSATWDPLNNEIVFLIADPDSKFSYNVNVAFSVALNDVDEVIRGQHPVRILRLMAGEVENVLNLTEAMCKTIGIS